MTNKIPPRPEAGRDLAYDEVVYAQLDHEHAVAKVAVEQVKSQRCLCDMNGYECNRCKTLRQIKSSGWTP